VDGVVAGTGATLPATAFALGDRVACDIVAADPFLTAPTVTTPTVTIANGAPTVTAVVFEPASPDVTTDVVAVPIFEDPEGDFVTFTYAWRVNAVPVPAVTGNRLAGGRYRKGQRVSVIVTPSDELRAGAPFTSTEVVIANAPPSLASASLSPTFPTRGSGATCVPSGWFDPDLDTPRYFTSWFVNGSLVSTASTLPGSAITRGDLVSCTLVPDDGTDVGDPVESPLVAVANSSPTLSAVLLDPTSPTELDTITAIAVGLADPDPSDAGQLSVAYAWRVNDVDIAGVSGPELGPEHFDRGDRISVIAAAFDGFGSGAVVSSGTVEARNLPPEVRSVSLLPDPAFTDSTLSVAVDATDPDPADVLTFEYAWEVAGSVVLSGAQATLPGTFFRKGQQVRVGVSASDGDLASERVWTDLATIRNATPTTPVVRMNPRWSAPGGAPLVCQFVVPSTDADGDSLAYSVTWTRDGQPYVAGDGLLGPRRTTIPGDTVPSADVAAGSTWTCTLTASDGVATSVPVSAVGRVVASDLTSLVAGAGFTCGLEPDGTPRCWGGNAVGQAIPPDDLVATRLSAGVSAGCGIAASGDVSCWGFVPSPSGGSFREVGTGTVHACGITNGGSAACWGVNTSGSTSPPSGTWRDLVVGSSHACALDADSDPRCWGANDRGQTSAPAVKFLRLSSGGDFTCGVRIDGTLRCWGATPPGTVPSGTFVDVVAGANHVCALRADDVPVCWGDSSQVELQPPAGVTFATLALGTKHTCGLTTGGVTRCWGDDLQGELRPPTLDVRRIVAGDGITCAVLADDGLACWGRFGTGAAAVPAFVVGVLDVTLGDAHACALGLDGEITCWGDGSLGQTASPTGDRWVQIDAGSNHTCAVDLGGAVSCWGSGFRGQLAVPSSGGPWAQVAAGGGHSCARSVAGAVVCWGGNDRGQAQAPPGRFLDLAVGVDHTCAVREDTTIACWGDNAARQASPPVLPGWRQVSLGLAHGCAVSVADVLECWGTSAYRLNTIPTLTGFDEVRAGTQHTCGMRVDGREQCWGLYGF
jgi:alpha-tubulin suppressor-like RCC1 family protein